jgi:hypothetical protein
MCSATATNKNASNHSLILSYDINGMMSSWSMLQLITLVIPSNIVNFHRPCWCVQHLVHLNPREMHTITKSSFYTSYKIIHYIQLETGCIRHKYLECHYTTFHIWLLFILIFLFRHSFVPFNGKDKTYPDLFNWNTTDLYCT